jgi:hypothetical protein
MPQHCGLGAWAKALENAASSSSTKPCKACLPACMAALAEGAAPGAPRGVDSRTMGASVHRNFRVALRAGFE